MAEQRNPYKGLPLRPWVRVRLTSADEIGNELELLADTGNPCAVIVDTQTMQEFNQGLGAGINTNFGPLEGGWLRGRIPEIAFDETVLGYAEDSVVEAAKDSHPDFDGLVGLPLLQMTPEYGGNREAFWIRSPES